MRPYGDATACEEGIPKRPNNFSLVCRVPGKVQGRFVCIYVYVYVLPCKRRDPMVSVTFLSNTMRQLEHMFD